MTTSWRPWCSAGRPGGPRRGLRRCRSFLPDSLYTVYDPGVLANYLTTVNGLLNAQGQSSLTAAQLTGGPNQLKAMVDLCHLYGIAVAFDVVYNHAGGFENDDESIYFWDREALPAPDTNNQSLFFTATPAVGGLSFALCNSGNKAMSDQLRFTQDFIRLRWNRPALRGESINAYYASNDDRVLAFHRWIEGQGLDVVVVASLDDDPFFAYQLGFPRGGAWAELFNSDIYDNWVNPLAVGNNGSVFANGGPMHGLPYSAAITIPPRAILVFGVQSA